MFRAESLAPKAKLHRSIQDVLYGYSTYRKWGGETVQNIAKKRSQNSGTHDHSTISCCRRTQRDTVMSWSDGIAGNLLFSGPTIYPLHQLKRCLAHISLGACMSKTYFSLTAVCDCTAAAARVGVTSCFDLPYTRSDTLEPSYIYNF